MAVWSEITSKNIADSDRIDSEHYKPQFLKIESKLQGYELLWKYVIDIIHPGEFPRRYDEDGWSVLRTQNVRPMSIEIEGNELFLNENIASNLTKNRIEFGDILVTRTGANFGQTSLFTDERNKAIVTSHSLIIKTNNRIDPAYLALYLNTSFGRALIDKGMYGSYQPEIAPKFLKKIPIPKFDINEEEKISKSVYLAYKLKQQSQSLYTQAQQLLEQELGLDKMTFEKPVGYEARFSEVMEGRRIDSQCYSPKHINYEKYLRANSRYELLRNVLSGTLKGKQMVALEKGNLKYVSIKDIQGLELITDSFCKPVPDKRIAEKNTLLLAITGATIGKVGIVNRYDSLAFSGDLLALITKDSITPHYLLAVLQSPIGQSQCFRWITGSTNGHLAPNDVGKIVVPRLKEKSEQKIAGFIVDALSARNESEELLEQAKSRVESLIEEAAKS